MPLSTSSSSDRVPGGPWLRTWVWVFAICGVTLGGDELFWRSQGYRPSMEDDAKLWAHWRSKASGGKSNKIVLLGSSRMETGFSRKAWLARFPNREVIQLAVNASSSIPVLKDLAEDETFSGTVVCEIDAWQIIRYKYRFVAQEYLDYYHHNWNYVKNADLVLLAGLQGLLVISRPSIGYKELFSAMTQFRPPKLEPFVIETGWDRCLEADFTRVDPQKLEDTAVKSAVLTKVEPYGSWEDWLDAVREVNSLVLNIQRRKGQVVFVQFPTSGSLRHLQEQYAPRSLYWNSFAKQVHAVTLHFEDSMELRSFVCPDGGHLDKKDTWRFTQALGDELVRRGVIELQPNPQFGS